VLARFNPIIRGWAAYYRIAVSSRTFHALDAYLWKLTYKWARHSHPNKPKRWVTTRYYGRFNTARQDHWVFGDRDSGAYLLKFSWTGIVRHQMVTGAASVDDPALVDYWARRRRRKKPPLNSTGRRLLQAQHGRCPACGGYSCTPTGSHKAPTNGNGGSPQFGWRYARKRSSSTPWRPPRTTLSRSCCTHTAGPTPSQPADQLQVCPRASRACLSRMR
jgi:RNA-directed DNA polymerase